MDALRFTARERARLALESEIAEADLGEISDTIFEFAQHSRASIRDRGLTAKRIDPGRKFIDRKFADVGDRGVADAHIQRVSFELRSRTNGAGHETAILREQDADVSFIAAPF